MMSCKNHPACQLLYRNKGHIKLRDIYRVCLGKRQGQRIWIVDGARVVQEIYPAFVMGGNDQRYRFNPENEVWIDNRIGIEELKYTIAHELIERKLMRERGWSYDRAHSEGGNEREKRLRLAEMRRVARKERSTGLVELGERGEKVSAGREGVRVLLTGIYRAYFGKMGGLSVWIVDGSKVRRDLEPNFSFGGHDQKYRFVPKGEIWLDAAMSVEEAYFVLFHESIERKLMAAGKSYEVSYPSAVAAQLDERKRQLELALDHEDGLAPVRYGTRERGVKKAS